MAYGIKTIKNGKGVLSPDGNGGVFIQLVTFSTTYLRRTFTDLGTMNLFYIVTSGGFHDIATGRDANGYPFIEAQGYPMPAWGGWPAGSFDTVVGVFAR